MSTTILAHYDGKVIVPDEPVDLPLNTRLSFTLNSVEASSHDFKISDAERDRRLAALESFVKRGVAVGVTDEAISRGSIYEEQD
jgi:hypothetical protein